MINISTYMNIFKYLKEKHPELFTYLPADVVHHHDRFLAKLFLCWLPDWITPNKLTLLRIILTPFVFLITLFGNYEFGVFLFLFAAFTDALDGSLARTKNKITKFGMLFDPLADKLLVGSMVLLLVFRYLNYWLGVSVLGVEIIFILSALIAYKFKIVKMANLWGKIKMVLQVLAVFTILLASLLDFPNLLTIASWMFGFAIGFAIISLFNHGI